MQSVVVTVAVRHLDALERATADLGGNYTDLRAKDHPPGSLVAACAADAGQSAWKLAVQLKNHPAQSQLNSSPTTLHVVVCMNTANDSYGNVKTVAGSIIGTLHLETRADCYTVLDSDGKVAAVRAVVEHTDGSQPVDELGAACTPLVASASAEELHALANQAAIGCEGGGIAAEGMLRGTTTVSVVLLVGTELVATAAIGGVSSSEVAACYARAVDAAAGGSAVGELLAASASLHGAGTLAALISSLGSAAEVVAFRPLVEPCSVAPGQRLCVIARHVERPIVGDGKELAMWAGMPNQASQQCLFCAVTRADRVQEGRGLCPTAPPRTAAFQRACLATTKERADEGGKPECGVTHEPLYHGDFSKSVATPGLHVALVCGQDIYDGFLEEAREGDGGGEDVEEARETVAEMKSAARDSAAVLTGLERDVAASEKELTRLQREELKLRRRAFGRDAQKGLSWREARKRDVSLDAWTSWHKADAASTEEEKRLASLRAQIAAERAEAAQNDSLLAASENLLAQAGAQKGGPREQRLDVATARHNASPGVYLGDRVMSGDQSGNLVLHAKEIIDEVWGDDVRVCAAMHARFDRRCEILAKLLRSLRRAKLRTPEEDDEIRALGKEYVKIVCKELPPGRPLKPKLHIMLHHLVMLPQIGGYTTEESIESLHHRIRDIAARLRYTRNLIRRQMTLNKILAAMQGREARECIEAVREARKRNFTEPEEVRRERRVRRKLEREAEQDDIEMADLGGR